MTKLTHQTLKYMNIKKTISINELQKESLKYEKEAISMGKSLDKAAEKVLKETEKDLKSFLDKNPDYKEFFHPPSTNSGASSLKSIIVRYTIRVKQLRNSIEKSETNDFLSDLNYVENIIDNLDEISDRFIENQEWAEDIQSILTKDMLGLDAVMYQAVTDAWRGLGGRPGAI